MKKIIGIISILILAGVAYGVYKYYQPPADTASKKADYSLEADAFLAEFSTDESQADAKYMDQIVELHGEIQSIEKQGETYLVQLAADNPLSGIAIEFQPNQDLSQYSAQDDISLRARYSGYLMGAALVEGVIIQK